MKFIFPPVTILVAAAALGASPAAASAESLSPDPDIYFPADFGREDLLAMLNTEHPRLFATSRDWQTIRERIPTSSSLTAARDIIVASAEAILPEPPMERTMIGRRLLFVSREVLNRVLTLGVAYNVTNDRRFFERARRELLYAAAFSDWNPSHFLDTAEMTMALAIGYDWLYGDLAAVDRAVLREAIIEKGLKQGIGPAGPGEQSTWTPGVKREQSYWKLKDNNWVQVCFGGMVAGALAVAEHEPDLAVTFLRETFTHIHQSLAAYRPDGAYPEGPGYWSYGTHYSVMLISVLESALGAAWGLDRYPGFEASATYINLMIGPSGKKFNYSDNSERVDPAPALHWFAARARNPALDARERDWLLADPEAFDTSSGWHGRFFPFTLIWMDPTLEPEARDATLPLHWLGEGLNPIAVHRSSWDKHAFFVGLKGGQASNNHGHMDIGSFVLDWKGLRWAFDFGGQGYHSLESAGLSIWGYKDQASQRWEVFRINHLSHNTLVIDDRPQLIDGFAPITAFSADPKAPFSVVDMSAVYRDSVDRAIRGVRLVDDNAVLIHDELTGLAAGLPVRWGMMTEAGVHLNGDRAVLRLNGETLHARVVEPAGARFAIVSTDPPPNDYDEPNPGTRMLAVFVSGDGAKLDLRVAFSSDALTGPILERLRAMPPPSTWRTSDPRRPSTTP